MWGIPSSSRSTACARSIQRRSYRGSGCRSIVRCSLCCPAAGDRRWSCSWRLSAVLWRCCCDESGCRRSSFRACRRCGRWWKRHLKHWPLIPHVVESEDDKLRAFRLARAALTASGTVTLELALTGTPMVVAYRVDWLAAPFLRRMITAPSIVLPNLILGRNAFPEFIQEKCTPSSPGRCCLGGDAVHAGPRSAVHRPQRDCTAA